MHKLLVLLALAGCGSSDQCEVNTPCSPGSANHYQFCNGGADDCFYISGDGHRFHCVTCGNCSEAQSLVSDWCQAQPAGTTSGRSSNSGLTCGGTTSCLNGGGSYQACASLTGTQCVYQTSDGTSFNCNSCSDCNAAVQNVLAWCNGGGGSSSTGSSSGGSDATCFSQTGTACQTCCAANHRDGSNYYAQAYITCGCGYCSAQCNVAGDVCHGGTSQSSDCANCLSTTAQQSCGQQLLTSCEGNAACSGFLGCVESCVN
jgi:hypothetical protein